MAIGVIAKLQVIEGKNQEFETAFKQLAETVNASEDGCLFYAFHQSRDDAQTYIVLEQYADEQALKDHGKTEHYKNFGRQASSFIAAPPQIELMDSI